MEITLKSATLFAAIILTGLSAGFFYAWQVSVIPGTKKVMDPTYMETMQHINREILNPSFFLIFFGSMIVLAISTFQQYGSGVTFWLLLGATVTYTLGTFAVTGTGNVPLNNELEALKLTKMSALELTEFRQYYESKWNVLHRMRTIFSVIAFVLSLLAAFSSTKNI
ncbi:DUF1772 domain-containing protein [Ekhidna sp.]|jgi:uncharacterized membrane protein|uniref:anthrone oxygenase family protein n=1 Tax=Ekhidna sp. TaxID=2608089 RepID=UPI0032F07EDD